MQLISVSQLSENMNDYIHRVFCQGESFVLTDGDKAVAELRPALTGRKLGELGNILKYLPRLSPQELEDFSKELTEIRAEANREGLRDPWE